MPAHNATQGLPASLKALASIRQEINDYSQEGSARKDAMHTKGRTFVRQLATDLGLAKGDYDIRSNRAGIAVSGEVTLHADHLYVQLSESFSGGGGVSALYRSCSSRKDYAGHQNHHIAVRDLGNGAYAGFVAQCATLMRNAADLENDKQSRKTAGLATGAMR